MNTRLQHAVPVDAQAALAYLWKAFAYARDMELDPWGFALGLAYLVKLGVSETDLRWLVLNGYVEQAEEQTTSRDSTRRFRLRANVAFTGRTCFVLSEAGADLAASLLDAPAVVPTAFPPARISRPRTIGGQRLPQWAPDERVLRLGLCIVKRFDKPAPNQEAVLMAFEEDGWPGHIDDPLAPVSDLVPKERLRFTIRRLNTCQERPLIRFSGDGTGQGIRWERVEAALSRKLRGAAWASLERGNGAPLFAFLRENADLS
ncbi:MAG: hypothetical protein ACLP9L_07195 [Thermoguttaceae bacterium]